MPETRVVTLRLDAALLKKIDEMSERRSRELYEDRTDPMGGDPFRGKFTGENRADTIRWLLELGLHHESRRQFLQWKTANHGQGKRGAK